MGLLHDFPIYPQIFVDNIELCLWLKNIATTEPVGEAEWICTSGQGLAQLISFEVMKLCAIT